MTTGIVEIIPGKVCGGCKEWKASDQFSRASRRTDGLQFQCKACNKRYRDDNIVQCRAVVVAWYKKSGWQKRIARCYGVALGWYETTSDLQGGVCAVCGDPPAEGKRFVVDHDRACCDWEAKYSRPTCGACNRGLLCSGCNTSLGHVERPEWLAKAQAYVARSEYLLRAGRKPGADRVEELKKARHYLDEMIQRAQQPS